MNNNDDFVNILRLKRSKIITFLKFYTANPNDINGFKNYNFRLFSRLFLRDSKAFFSILETYDLDIPIFFATSC